jgi:CubicO group peptidase (beta-lactamase class C family)
MKNAWLNNHDWLQPCSMGKPPSHYSNWGSLTLGFAVTQLDGYNYDKTLGSFILPNFGMTAQYTNTCADTPCVQGYRPGGGTKATGSAHGIRTNISEMINFVGNYLYYLVAPNFIQLSGNREVAAQMVGLALSPPLSKVPNWGLDWNINNNFQINDTSYQLFGKDGMSGAQGFSSYVGIIETLRAPYGFVIQVGVLIMVNMACKGQEA